MNTVFRNVQLCLMAAIFTGIMLPAFAQYGVKNEQWNHYAGDHGSTRYSPTTQINRKNFDSLEVARIGPERL